MPNSEMKGSSSLHFLSIIDCQGVKEFNLFIFTNFKNSSAPRNDTSESFQENHPK
jgi:hypothetical protein